MLSHNELNTQRLYNTCNKSNLTVKIIMKLTLYRVYYFVSLNNVDFIK